MFLKFRFVDEYGRTEWRSTRFFRFISDFYVMPGRLRPPGVSAFADESRSKIDPPRDEMFFLCSNFFLRIGMRDMPRLTCSLIGVVAMYQSTIHANASLARVLTHAIDAADKPKHQIAREAGVHRETLLKIMRGERSISIERAMRIFQACGACPHAAIVLTLAGEEVLACEWMYCETGTFLDAFITSLPGQLDRTLGRRVTDIRSRWAPGTSQLVAKLLARHIDDLANRDIAMSLTR